MKILNLAMLAVLLPFASAYATTVDTRHPCKQIVNACETAGFTKNGHKENKGLYKDCVSPIRSGQSVAGVNIDPSVVQACSAKKAEKSVKTSS